MKRITTVPTTNTIKQLLNAPSIQSIIEDWSIEYDVIIRYVERSLNDLGLYEVDPIKHRKIVINAIKSHLYNNEGIQGRIKELAHIAQEQNDRKKRKTPGS